MHEETRIKHRDHDSRADFPSRSIRPTQGDIHDMKVQYVPQPELDCC